MPDDLLQRRLPAALSDGIRGVRFHTGRGSAGPHIPRLLELIGDRAIRPDRVASETLSWEDAPQALVDPSHKPVFLRER